MEMKNALNNNRLSSGIHLEGGINVGSNMIMTFKYVILAIFNDIFFLTTDLNNSNLFNLIPLCTEFCGLI